jgi:hypothetical protein
VVRGRFFGGGEIKREGAKDEESGESGFFHGRKDWELGRERVPGPIREAYHPAGRVQFKVMSFPLSSLFFIFLFRQERAGRSERSEKPDERER